MYIQDFDGNEDSGQDKEEHRLAKLEAILESDGFDRVLTDRRLVLQVLKDVLDSPANDIDRVIAAIHKMAEHPDSLVRASLMEQVPHMALFCDEERSKLGRVEAELLPLVLQMQQDKVGQVRKSSQAALLVLMEENLVQQQAIEQLICPAVVELTQQINPSPAVAVSAVALMSKMAPVVGKLLTERFFLDRFAQLCQHDDANLREACSKTFGDLCAVLGTQVTELSLVPLFLELCCDSMWGVRMACADVFMSVSCVASLPTRRSHLTQALSRLLTDPSQWVRISAFQVLGAFICTFAEPSVIGLAYDQQGDLVFVNPDGFKFSLKSPRNMAKMVGVRDYGSYCASRSEQGEIADEGELNLDLYTGRFRQDDSTPAEFRLASLFSYDSAADSQKPSEQEEDAFNSFNFWRFPVDDLDEATATTPDTATSCDVDDDIKAEIKSLDNELSRLSEKLAKCSTNELSNLNKRLEDVDAESTASVISSVSRVSPDSGWGSAEAPVTPPGVVLLPPQHAGNKAVTAPQDMVPQVLLDHFLSMTHPAHAEITDKEMTQYCAYSLPGVAYTLGAKHWLHIRDVFCTLSNDVQWKVRRTVAASIHELASILGEDLATRDLAPVFGGFLLDLDEVRIGALEHLSEFLRALRPDTRHAFLPHLKKLLMTDNDRNWRFRDELAQQLMLSVTLFQPAEFVHHVGSMTATLLADKVAAVRATAVLLAAHLLFHLTWEPKLRSAFLIKLSEQFAKSESWFRRQTFVLLCSRLASQRALDEAAFHELVLPQLLTLGLDRVCNVRLCVARCLARDCVASGYLTPDGMDWETVKRTLTWLEGDADTDVRYFASLQNALTQQQELQDQQELDDTQTTNTSQSPS